MGVLRGIPALLGTAFGTGSVLFIVGYGFGAILLENEHALTALRIVGMGAIFWFAWLIATAPVPTTTEQDNAQVVGFVPTFLLQWLNPKAWIVSVSIVGAFMATDSSVLKQASTLSTVFFSAAVLGCFPWLASGAALRRILQDPKIARLVNFGLGLGLAASMITLL